MLWPVSALIAGSPLAKLMTFFRIFLTDSLSALCSTKSAKPGIVGIACLLSSWPLLAAEADQSANVLFWNLVIAVIVLAATLASAALPLAAWRQWQESWRLAALAPLLVLALWVGIIVLSRLSDPNSHRLWPFELFSWAMLNMIYMVAVMTYKRQIDKAAAERAASQSADSSSDQA
jgi:hypothetical protein